MLVDITSASSIYASTDSSSSSSSSDLGSTDFLTLLIAQLEYQDPLNPMEDTEMLSELASFSQLEQLVAMNESLETMSSVLNASLVNSAVGFIGMEVKASGDTITKGDDGITSIGYSLDNDYANASAYIYDSDGELVDTVSLTGLSEGDHTFTWDGTTSDGSIAPDGTYTVEILAQDTDGEYYSVSTEVEGTVVGLSTVNGSTVFVLDDGRTVDILAVTDVSSPTSNTNA
ncbi:flagellar hook assembly protein FlgD [Megalodesulfovibrio paquesii]